MEDEPFDYIGQYYKHQTLVVAVIGKLVFNVVVSSWSVVVSSWSVGFDPSWGLTLIRGRHSAPGTDPYSRRMGLGWRESVGERGRGCRAWESSVI